MFAVLLVVVGTVTGASSRWAGDVIVTEAQVRDVTGSVLTLVQLGGSVDGLTMVFTHQPPLVRAGDRVTIDPATRSLIDLAPAPAHLAPAGGTATYGLQRTTKSGRPLWHASGCLDVVYDATTIDPAQAKVLDAAFAAWTSAAARCGQIVATSTRRPNPPATRDELSTVHIRRDRWCNPGNALEPEVCYAKDASAVTRLLFIDDPGDADDGKIIDADVELNAVDYVLLAPDTTAPPTTKPVVDLQAVATHEVGHALGLAHNCGTGDEPWPTDRAGSEVPACATASPDVRAATMYYAIAPGDVSARSVEPTDVTGVCELARELTCEAFVTGGCSTTPARAPTWLLLAAVWFATARKRSTTRRRGIAGT